MLKRNSSILGYGNIKLILYVCIFNIQFYIYIHKITIMDED